MTTAEPVRELLDEAVAHGRLPGYAVAVRHGGETHTFVGGTLGLGSDVPIAETTPFRLSSVTKLFAAVLAMSLVEDGVLRLDDPITRWCPELAEPRVLRDRHGPLDATEPAMAPVTVEHLLTGTSGWGGMWEPSPLQDAMRQAGLFPGPFAPDLDPDEYLRRLAEVPLAAQPGEAWLYHTGSDLLGVVLARATGQPLAELLDEHVLGPLGLTGTRFHAAAESLPVAYQPDEDGSLKVLDEPDGRFASPPRFESLATGLVSTAPDVLTLMCALADGGGPVLSPRTVELMTTDALSDPQRAYDTFVLGEGTSWGLHVGLDIGQDPAWGGLGRFGWDGGTGTSAWVDPGRDVVGVMLTQRGMESAADSPEGFWRAVAAGVG
jgi:CubicO group peptidase (beta-lactamase class C family)